MAERHLSGLPAAPGLAHGMVSVVEDAQAPLQMPPGTREEERAALLSAIRQAQKEVEALAARSAGDAGDMLSFQAAMLADDELARPALDAIASGTPALAAWDDAMAAEAACYAAGSPALAARTSDLEDIRSHVRGRLAPGPARPGPPPGAVIAASDLPLSQFLGMDWSQGGAIVLTGGSPAGHVAMLARAQGVPMVVGVGGTAQALAGHSALVNAAAGEVVLDPGPAARTAFAARAAAPRSRTPAATTGPAATRDGTRIALSLVIGGLAELDGLDPAASDGIGLVRTELLFHGSNGGHGSLPDEDAQYRAYRRILAWAAGRTAVIRALDAGGDKPMPGEAPGNGDRGGSRGFLGLRGIRLLLQSPALFRTQLRALARAAAHGDLRVLLPMVTVPGEFAASRALLDEVVRDLERQGTPARRPLLGIMVEVPAAAIAIDRFEAEFFSIGTNDLTACVTAAGRDVGSVAHLADPLNPAVLHLVAGVARHGRATGRGVSLCGDAASDPRCIGPMLRAGVRALSAAPNALGQVRAAIAATDLHEGPA